MKVGVFSPYLGTMGGGERYILSAVEFFLNRNDTVEIFSNDKITYSEIKDRFDLDLSKAVSKKQWDRWMSTIGYDLMFFVSDGSIPTSLAAKNILHFQVPFSYKNQITILNRIKLSRFNWLICNSEFTKKFVDRTYGVKSEVVYPPVDVEKFKSGKKENMILSVGRFFAPLQAKKQEVLINVFTKMKIPGWRLVLIGGVEKGLVDRVTELRALAGKNPVEIITDVKFETLREYYSRSKIYWHAAGFGENLEQFPERAEHFGISTVEAMSAGCVPIVFAGGGQKEIVDNEQTGFLWNDTNELVSMTRKMVEDEHRRKLVAGRAVKSSIQFSKEKFFQNLERLLR